jgi:hypothetical protein
MGILMEIRLDRISDASPESDWLPGVISTECVQKAEWNIGSKAAQIQLPN